MKNAEAINVRNLNLAGLNSESDFHDRLIAVFNLPHYYGRNLDAFWDCLREISEPTHGTVEYGLTTSYGKNEKTSSSDTIYNSVRLSEIMPGATYHFRIKAEDDKGNKTTSGDYTFTSGIPAAGRGLSATLPTKNVIWKSGGSEKLRWNSDYANLPLDIYLAGGSLTAPIRLKSTNASHAPYSNVNYNFNALGYTGTETVTVPSATAAPAGGNYYVLYKINNVEVGRTQSFAIATNPGPITITLPGTTLRKGSTYTISWNRQDDFYGSGISAYLVGGAYTGDGKLLSPIDNKSITWTIGADVPVGTYKIKLMQVNTDGVYSRAKVAESASFTITN